MTKSAKKTSTSSWASSRKEMPKKMCKKLIGADPNLGWRLLGDLVMKKLLGSDVVPVSCPEDSACFDLGTVLVKDHQSLTARAAHRHTTLRAIGTVQDMSVSAPANLRTILAPKADENWEAAPSSGFPWSHTIGNEHDGERKRFYVKVGSDGKFIISKQIFRWKDSIHWPEECPLATAEQDGQWIQVGSVAKEVVHLTLKKGDLRLRNDTDDLRKAKAVYIVTEAFYASGLKVEVTVDGRQGCFVTEDKILIGFRYQKFKLSKVGVVGPELSTNIKRNREAHLFVKTSYAERVRKSVTSAELRKPSNASVALSPKASLPGMTDETADPRSIPVTKDDSKESRSSAVSDVTEKDDRCQVVDLDHHHGDEGSKGQSEGQKADTQSVDSTQCVVG